METQVTVFCFGYVFIVNIWNLKGIWILISLRAKFKRLVSRVFLLRQLWIVNYYIKSLSINLSNENINTGVSFVFKRKRELFLKYNFSGNTNSYDFITEIIWWTFDRIIDDPYLT